MQSKFCGFYAHIKLKVCLALSQSGEFTNWVSNEEILQESTANGNAKLPCYVRSKRRTQQNNHIDL